MSHQVLTILEEHTRRPQSPAKGVLEVVNSNAPESRRRRLIVLLLPGAAMRNYGTAGTSS